MKAALSLTGSPLRTYIKYIAFLAWSVACVIVGIALMTVTAIGVCTEAFR